MRSVHGNCLDVIYVAFECLVVVTIAGMELRHRIRKRQLHLRGYASRIEARPRSGMRCWRTGDHRNIRPTRIGDPALPVCTRIADINQR